MQIRGMAVSYRTPQLFYRYRDFRLQLANKAYESVSLNVISLMFSVGLSDQVGIHHMDLTRHRPSVIYVNSIPRAREREPDRCGRLAGRGATPGGGSRGDLTRPNQTALFTDCFTGQRSARRSACQRDRSDL